MNLRANWLSSLFFSIIIMSNCISLHLHFLIHLHLHFFPLLLRFPLIFQIPHPRREAPTALLHLIQILLVLLLLPFELPRHHRVLIDHFLKLLLLLHFPINRVVLANASVELPE